MQKAQAQDIIRDTFGNAFDEGRFRHFARNLLNHIEEEDRHPYSGQFIAAPFQPYINTLKRLGKYSDGEHEIDILVVQLKKESSLERARTAQRNFIARYLNGSRGGKMKDAALVAFVSPNEVDWRFSLIKMDYKFVKGKTGATKVKEDFTPARRWSFLVGPNEHSHTAQARLTPIIEDEGVITLARLEEAFNIEKVTKEFFEKYRGLFADVKEALDTIITSNAEIQNDFADRFVSSVDFSKRLLGQIVFLYFLQKKGWFGVPKDKKWGEGDKNFIRNLFKGEYLKYKNFYNEILEPLFYDALALDRSHLDHWNDHFRCKIPFLNGGLFDNKYNWHETEIELPNELFSNGVKDLKTGDFGTGILDIFDRYNFTVKEDEPLEKEVAVDPEMLGKVFENLLEVKDRKSKGTYYTPREIVKYMCQQSILNYLSTSTNVKRDKIQRLILKENLPSNEVVEHALSKLDIEELEKEADKAIFFHRNEVAELDTALNSIRVADPACGSGAFLIGMLNEIVDARKYLHLWFSASKEIEPSRLKRITIENSIYGVDIDPGAVEIAKLRLWLSLVVDEDDIKQIKPLPNLDYKIMQGNSLLEEFEGIRLFDEKLLQSPIITSDLLDPVNELISKLQSELLKYYGQHPEWMQKGEHKDKPIEVFELEKRLRDVMKQNKKIKENSTEQKDLFSSPYKESLYIRERLENLHKEFFKETNVTKKDELKHNINNLEWLLIESSLEEKGKTSELKKIQQFKSLNTRPFFLWKLHFSEVFQEKGGFDIVIANPPYVRQEEFVQIKEGLRSSYKEFYNGRADLYTYFIKLGFDLAKKGGFLTYITSNKFFVRGYGKNTRSLLTKKVRLHKILNFGELPVFQAAVDSAILIAENKIPETQRMLSFAQAKTEHDIFNIDEFFEKNKITISADNLGDTEWALQDTSKLAILNKIKKHQNTLRSYCNADIFAGIKTGYDEAFVIDEKTRNDLIKKDGRCKALIKPWLRGKDIKKWNLSYKNLFIIYVSSNKISIDNYPSIKEYLLKFRSKLQARATNQKWWEMQQPQERFTKLFDRPKIIYPDCAKEMRACYDETGAYGTMAMYFIPYDSVILGLLNSSVFDWYSRMTFATFGDPWKGGRIIFKTIYMAKFPIPPTNNSLSKLLSDNVEKILKITKEDDYLGNIEKQAEVHNLERQIDELVYKLYGLTDEEIKIVEQTP